MKRFVSLFAVAAAFGLNAATTALAAPRPAAARPTDTIVVRLPNQASLTILVRNTAQLRELPKYQLDSLTRRLATYITQAETAAQAGTNPQVTMEFYPDKDRPGQNLPEKVRITARKQPASNKVVVMLNKKFGMSVDTDEDGDKSIHFNTNKQTAAQRQARKDSSRQRTWERRAGNSYLVLDLGLNALTNQKALAGGRTADLRTEGSRYVNLGLNWFVRLGGKRSPLGLLVGPEFAFNNYMLEGNDKWVSTNGTTEIVRETDPKRQFEKTKLATSAVNLPLMLHLQLHDQHYRSTFSLSAGGFVGYRLKSWTKLKYITDGTTYKDKDYGSYNMENFQYGLQGTLGYRSLELFAKYNLNPLFRSGQGPEAQVVSFGVRLFGID